MRPIAMLCLVLVALPVAATLPPPTEDALAKSAEAKAKAAWSDKVAAYQLCLAQDRTVQDYRRSAQAAGKPVPPAAGTTACTDPGPYVAQVTPMASKPLEAAGAHSPPGTATSPPSTPVPAKELSGPSPK